MTLNVFLETTPYLIESCHQCWKVGIIKFILQVKKLRLRKVKSLVIDTQLVGRRASKMETWSVCLQKLVHKALTRAGMDCFSRKE